MKTTIAFALVVLIAVGGYLTFVHYKTGNDVDLTIPPDGAISMEGTTTCLPHKDTEGPQTLECAFGLYGTDQNYYAIIDATATSSPSTFGMSSSGTRVEVQGTFTRAEDTKYASVGTIEVTAVRMLDEETVSSGDTVSDGILTFTRPVGFGLATTLEQILVESVIPPCETGFLYCFYFMDDEYAGTNFESAGVAVRPRPDLQTEGACMETAPEGYPSLEARSIVRNDSYVVSLFSPLGDAGAGHYSFDEEYRLFTSNTCYQITTRVGTSQFLNYPEGTITEFTEDDQAEVTARMTSFITSITVEDGTRISIPE